jgi:hypothetical protein
MKLIKLIKLTKGMFAIVDDEDFDIVNSIKWNYSHGYASRNKGCNGINHRFMHRFILNYDGSLQVDHINGNRLDNRKENLRIVTNQQNQFNRNKNKKGGTSKYKGVYFNRDNNNWRARICLNGITYNIGSFKNEEEAFSAYKNKASKLFGEYIKK